MRSVATLLLALSLAVPAIAQDKKQESVKRTAAAGKPSTPTDRMSYSIGADIGKNLRNNQINLSISQFFAGIQDAFTGKPLALNDKELSEGIVAFRTEMQQAPVKAAKAFLTANGKKPGVQTTASGLQYKVVKAGNGNMPKLTDTVTTHYEGKVLSGKVFDSSYKKGMPATFPVNRVIAGWQEALQLMKIGDKWQLFIPSKLAYGTQPPPGSGIGPNEMLIFDIELLKIEAPKE